MPEQPAFAHLWAVVTASGFMCTPFRTRRDAIRDREITWAKFKRAHQLRCVRGEAREIFTSLDHLTEAQTKDLAAKIVNALCQPGGGRLQARRLQLRGPNEEDLGGWGKSGAVGKVAEVLFTARQEASAVKGRP